MLFGLSTSFSQVVCDLIESSLRQALRFRNGRTEGTCRHNVWDKGVFPNFDCGLFSSMLAGLKQKQSTVHLFDYLLCD